MSGSAIQTLLSIDQNVDQIMPKEILLRQTTVVVNKLARNLFGIVKADLSKEYSFRRLPVHDVSQLPGSRIQQSFVPVACAAWDDSSDWSDSDQESEAVNSHQSIKRSISEPNLLWMTPEREEIFEGHVDLPKIVPQEP